MNRSNWERGQKMYHARALACQTEGHDWLEPDPITGRTYCRRCVAFLPGEPDRRQAAINDGSDVADALGWLPLKEKPYGAP